MRIRSCFLLALALGCGHGLSADVLYTVTVTPLGNASAINNEGQITGMVDGHAVLYGNGQITDLGPGSASAINSAGQITGMVDGHAVLYSNRQITDLGTLGGSTSAGNAINNIGQVAGSSTTLSGDTHAFVYGNGQMTDLSSSLPAGVSSFASGINDAGQVVGNWSTAGGGYLTAFLYNNGHVMYLPSTNAVAINDIGQVTGGFCSPPLVDCDAFLYSNGQFEDLGSVYRVRSLKPTFTVGKAVNNGGQIVGRGDDYGGSTAFVYSNGRITDLRELIDPALGIGFREATGINDSGQIVANGSQLGVPGEHAYLLTPVPEPNTFALFGVALLGLCLWTSRMR